MTRVKRGTIAAKHRRNVLQRAKGFRWRRSKTERAANEALLKAGSYAYRDRRARKRTMRALWILRMNNAARAHGVSYSRLAHALRTKRIALDRKMLAYLAVHRPTTFAAIVRTAMDARK